MALVDDLEAQDTATLNGRLQQAAHDRSWAQTFSNTPPTEVLRANRNYDDLIKQAADRTLAIRAQTDPVAQKMLFDQKLQPLKEALELGKIEHQAAATVAAGALERFRQKKDQETMGDTVGFLDWMERAPAKPGTPEYQAHSLQGLKKFPRVISNEVGKEVLSHIAEEHDGIAKLNDATVTRYARVRGELESHQTEAGIEAKRNTEAKLADVPYSKSAELHAAKKETEILESAHPSLKTVVPETEGPKPTPIPKHLGKYNPATGKFE